MDTFQLSKFCFSFQNPSFYYSEKMLSLPKDTIFSLLKRMVFYRSFLLFLNMCKFKSKTENLGERMFSLCSFSSLCL